MQISENYRIVFDENNVILQYFEIRERVKKDGTAETYEYQSNTFHGSVKQALKAFLAKNLIGSKSVEDLVARIESVEEKINLLNVTEPL